MRLSPDVDVRDKGGRAETPISFDLDALARVGCGQSDASEVQPLLFSFTIVLAPLTRIACISAKEFAAMASHALVATQISSLFPSAHALSLIVQTRRTDIPLPDESDSEHASHSNIFYAPSTGTILLRVIHGGHIVELISLSSDSPPLRFVYPSPVLPHPSLLLLIPRKYTPSSPGKRSRDMHHAECSPRLSHCHRRLDVSSKNPVAYIKCLPNRLS